MVRLDSGKHYPFSKVKGLDEIEPLLRVQVLHVEKGPSGAVVTGFEDGRKEFGAPLRPRIRSAPGGDSAVRNPEAPPNGTIVTHKNYGRGTVVGATAKMIRVRFDGDAKDRTIRPSGVELSD